MKPREYSERQVEIEGWQVRLTSYKVGDVFYCQADNVSPGAWLARTTGDGARRGGGEGARDCSRAPRPNLATEDPKSEESVLSCFSCLASSPAPKKGDDRLWLAL